jgi:hypothetical protein
MIAVSDFSRWMNAYERLYDNPSELSTTPCPSCAVRGSLRLIFVVGGSDPETALAKFWCDACLVGLVPLRAPLPPHGERVAKGYENVPNYRLVVAESFDE